MSAASRNVPRRPASWIAIGALLLAATLWSLNGVLIKYVNQVGLSGLEIACYRSLLGGLILLPLGWRTRETLARVHWMWPVASVTAFTVMTVCFVIATTGTEASNAIILQYTAPIWIFLLSPLILGESPSRRDAIVLLVAMAGVAVIFFGNPSALPILLIALTSGVGFGAVTLLTRRLRDVHPTMVTTLNMLGSGLLLAVFVLLYGSLRLTAEQAGLLVMLSVVQFTLPYVLFSWSLRYVQAYGASLIVLLETVLNPTWTWLFLGERPPTATLLGGPLILASVVLWTLLSRKPRRSAESHPA